MLKLDGTSGGEAVVPVYDPARLGRAFLGMRLRRAGLSRLKHARQNRTSICRSTISTMARRASPFRPMCRAGLRIVRSPAGAATYSPRRRSRPYAFKSTLGASSVVRVVEGAQMKAAARAIVRQLGLSGHVRFRFHFRRRVRRCSSDRDQSARDAGQPPASWRWPRFTDCAPLGPRRTAPASPSAGCRSGYRSVSAGMVPRS